MKGLFAPKLALVVSTNATSFQALQQGGSLADSLAMASGFGYDGVELAVRDPALVDWKTVEAMLSRIHLAVPAIGTGQAYLDDGLSLTSPDETNRRKAVERFRSHLALGERLGSAVILGLIRGGREGDVPARAKRLMQSLRECADAMHTPVLIEPLNRYECDLLENIRTLTHFLDELNLPQVGILFDTFHANIEEPSLEASLLLARRHLKHVHFADSNRLYPGGGHTDFYGFLRTLGMIGYDGWISMEMLPLPTPKEAAAKAILHIRNFF